MQKYLMIWMIIPQIHLVKVNYVTYIKLDEGEIWLECYDWSTQLNKEKIKIIFGVNLMSKEYLYWLRNKAINNHTLFS